jgi:plastocyanin
MRMALAALAALMLLPGAAPAADPAVCREAQRRYAALPDADKAPAGTVAVLAYKFTFCPAEVTVKPGTTVRWINVERTSHSVWLKDKGEPEGERMMVGESWDFTFQTPGEYPYLCGPHWESDEMVGKVVVKE